MAHKGPRREPRDRAVGVRRGPKAQANVERKQSVNRAKRKSSRAASQTAKRAKNQARRQAERSQGIKRGSRGNRPATDRPVVGPPNRPRRGVTGGPVTNAPTGHNIRDKRR